MSFKKLLSSFLIGAGFLAVIIAGVLGNNVKEIKAAPTSPPAGSVVVTGYAWSDNIGWISFNPSYGGVFYSISTGQLSGYAWSDNIGWISFNGLSASGGVGGSGAKADSPSSLTTSAVSGWARACAGTQSAKDKCDNMTSRTDGWDGWIKMSDSWSPGVSVNFPTGDFSGYAWGSDVAGG